MSALDAAVQAMEETMRRIQAGEVTVYCASCKRPIREALVLCGHHYFCSSECVDSVCGFHGPLDENGRCQGCLADLHSGESTVTF